MSMLATDIASRVIQVLTDNIASELALIDAERGGDPTEAPIAYSTGPGPVQDNYPGINVDTGRWEFVDLLRTDTIGELRYNAHLTVEAYLQTSAESSQQMRDLAERYLAAMVRILLFRNNGLETIADPTRFCLMTEKDGDATVVEPDQSSGAMTRTVRLPIVVWMDEGLS